LWDDESVTAVADQRLVRWPPSLMRSRPARLLVPFASSAVAVLNAVLFLLIRPDVNDLWAARARASAVRNGVGLSYWFSWFGGSTPGNYSVLTPYISAYTTAEVLGAVSAVAIPLLCILLTRGTEHPLMATAVAAFTAGVNLWSGRVPFLFGGVFAVAALIFVRRKQTAGAVGFSLVSIAASPVTGAFVAVGLAGLFLSHRGYRRISLITIVAILAGMGVDALAFGTPGPEPFSEKLKVEVVCGLLLLLCARPVIWLRTTLWLSVIAAFVLAWWPNGMGANFARFAWFCLPVAVVALSRFRVWILTLIIAPLLVTGVSATYQDLRNAREPVSTVAYYQPLAAQLDTITDLQNYRVEVVNHGAHAAYDALLNHATLARGWETQEDNALNQALNDQNLDAVTYKVWLNDNAVGYVALPMIPNTTRYPEYALVDSGRLPYLKLIWQTQDWKLYQVQHASQIVAAPATPVTVTQSQLTVDVPCACDVHLRIRFSKFLHVGEDLPPGSAPPSLPGESARVSDDGSGWTELTVPHPGRYTLRGSLSGGLLR
jgi:hypothetical protein